MKHVPAFLMFLAVFSAGTNAMAEFAESSTVFGPGKEAIFAFDGKPGTRWISRAHTKKPQWARMDFEKQVTVDAVTIKWARSHAREYKIQMSDDMKSWKTLKHVKNGKKHDKRVLKDLGGKGRYFRILCIRTGRVKSYSIIDVRFTGEAEARRKALAAVALKTYRGRKKATREEFLAELKTTGVEDVVFSLRNDGTDPHWYANFGHYSFDHNSKLYNPPGLLCKLNLASGKLTKLIDDPEGTIRDPVVHYDAEKVLFSWRKGKSEVFHLYECDMNGANIRQITSGKYDDLEPCYLPDDGIIFVSGRAKRFVNCWLTPVAVLYRCDKDGKNIRQLSANIEHDNTPWVLPDGRIIYMRWEYIDRSQVHYHHLWTANPDGTGQMVYYGNMHPGGVYIDAKPIPGTDEVLFINSPHHGIKEHAGYVAVVSDRNGPDDMSMMKNISRRNDYRDPWPLSKDLFMVSKGRKIVLMNRKGDVTDLWTVPPELKSIKIQEPRPVIKRKRERRMPSRVRPGMETGKLVLTDAYLGRNMKGIKPGEIKKLLVMESLPKPINYTGGQDCLSYGGSFTLERIVGTVPVEEDGSAFMELPANRSFFFIALDENNNSLKRMQSFTSVVPGEMTSCVGCHEERGTTPTKGRVGVLKALKRRASKPEPIAGIPDIMDFPRDIQPILDKHCIKCHDNRNRAGGISLTGDRGPIYSMSYIAFVERGQVADGRNRPKSNYAPRSLGATASPLMKKIDGSHPTSLPEDQRVKVSKQEENMIRFWIESAGCYPGTYAALGCGSIGGHQWNKQLNTDHDLQTLQGFKQSIKKRCSECHKKMPMRIASGNDLTFDKSRRKRKAHKRARNHVFNLTRPDESLFLLAPLSKKAGGLGKCMAEGDVFSDTNDPDYKAILAHLKAGKEFLEKDVTRFDMKNFKPRRDYLREMKRYGILPEDLDIDNPGKLDVYDIDRKYWQSLWYKKPDGSKPATPGNAHVM